MAPTDFLQNDLYNLCQSSLENIDSLDESVVNTLFNSGIFSAVFAQRKELALKAIHLGLQLICRATTKQKECLYFFISLTQQKTVITTAELLDMILNHALWNVFSPATQNLSPKLALLSCCAFVSGRLSSGKFSVLSVFECIEASRLWMKSQWRVEYDSALASIEDEIKVLARQPPLVKNTEEMMWNQGVLVSILAGLVLARENLSHELQYPVPFESQLEAVELLYLEAISTRACSASTSAAFWALRAVSQVSLTKDIRLYHLQSQLELLLKAGLTLPVNKASLVIPHIPDMLEAVTSLYHRSIQSTVVHENSKWLLDRIQSYVCAISSEFICLDKQEQVTWRTLPVHAICCRLLVLVISDDNMKDEKSKLCVDIIDILACLEFCKVPSLDYTVLSNYCRKFVESASLNEKKMMLVNIINSSSKDGRSQQYLLQWVRSLSDTIIVLRSSNDFRTTLDQLFNLLLLSLNQDDTASYLIVHDIVQKLLISGIVNYEQKAMPQEWSFIPYYIQKIIHDFPEKTTYESLSLAIGRIIGAMPSDRSGVIITGYCIDKLVKRILELTGSDIEDRAELRQCATLTFFLIKMVNVSLITVVLEKLEKLFSSVMKRQPEVHKLMLRGLYQVICNDCNVDRRNYLAKWYLKLTN